MKKETLKHLKKITRETLGPIPPVKVEPSEKEYKRKPKHVKKSDKDE
jgi:hypothetical protein